MEERRPTPLPPGVMPSGSREDLYAQLQEESEARKPEEQLLVQDVSSDEEPVERKPRKKGARERVVVVEVHPNVVSTDPPSAWRTEQEHVADGTSTQRTHSYRLPTEDLEGESSGSDVESVVSPVFKDPPTPSDKEKSIVESESTPTKKKKNILKEFFGSFQRPSTPPRPMSPFKKSNKVVPITSSSSKGDHSSAGGREVFSSPIANISTREGTDTSGATGQDEDVMQTTVTQSSPTVISNIAVEQFEEDVDNDSLYTAVLRTSSDVGSRPRTTAEVRVGSPEVVTSDSTVDSGVDLLSNVMSEEPLYSPVLKHKKQKKQKHQTNDGNEREYEILSNPSATNEEHFSEGLVQLHDVPPLAKITPVSTPVDGPSRQMGTQTDDVYYASIDLDPITDSESDENATEDARVNQNRKLKKLRNSLMKEQKDVTDGRNRDTPTVTPQQDPLDMLPIHYAAMRGNKKELSSIVAEMKLKGSSLDVPDCEGRTAIMHAVHREQHSCVRVLVDQGADINAKSFDGSTALHQAAYMNSLSTVAVVLGLGGDGTITDNDGRLPLHWATSNSSTECIKIILDKVLGIDVNVQDYVGMTPLMWAAYNDQPQNIQFLKGLGASTSVRDLDGMAAIHWAVHRNSTDSLQVLINSQSSRYKDNKGKTVMHVIAEQGCAKGVSMLRAVRPTSVNDIDNQGRTPMHWAAACEKPDAIRALLDAGGDPTIQDSNGYTPQDYASSKGYHYCVVLLEQYVTVGGPGSPSDSQMPSLVGTPRGTPKSCVSDESDLGIVSTRDHTETKQYSQLLQMLCHGGWLYKFTGRGRGPLHKRYFWLNIGNGKICWANSTKPSDSDIRADDFTDVRSSASSAISGRRDYDPLVKHKYAFTILTASRTLDVVATSSVEYKLWINGLTLLCQLGMHEASQVLLKEN